MKTGNSKMKKTVLFYIAECISTFFYIGKLTKKGQGTIASAVTVLIWYFAFSWHCQKVMSTDHCPERFNPYALVKNRTELTINHNDNYAIFIGALLLVIGSVTSSIYMKFTGKEDPKEVVIDEVLGQSLLIYLIFIYYKVSYCANFCGYGDKGLDPSRVQESAIEWLLCGFIFFRIFDIWKPWPIRLIDRKMKGGFGVMLDDIIAALVAFPVILSFCSEWFVWKFFVIMCTIGNSDCTI